MKQLILVCPICESGTHRHGGYNRWVYDGEERMRMRIHRVRCVNSKCRKTHAVLPSFLAPFRHHPMEVIETAVNRVEAGATVEAATVGAQSERTTSRWVKRAAQAVDGVVNTLRSHLARGGEVLSLLGEPRTALARLQYYLAPLAARLGEAVAQWPRFSVVNFFLTSTPPARPAGWL